MSALRWLRRDPDRLDDIVELLATVIAAVWLVASPSICSTSTRRSSRRGRRCDGARDRLPDAVARVPAGGRDRARRRSSPSPRRACSGSARCRSGSSSLVGLVAGSVRGLRAETTRPRRTSLRRAHYRLRRRQPCTGRSAARHGIGIGVGLLVNLLVWPRLADRAAARQVDVSTTGSGRLPLERRRRGDPRQATRPEGRWTTSPPGTTELDHEIEEGLGVVHQAPRELGAGITAQHRAGADAGAGRASAPKSSSASSRRWRDAEHDPHACGAST